MSLIPDSPIPQGDLQVALGNIVMALHNAIETEAPQLALAWAESAKHPSNIFMVDASSRTLLSSFIGYLAIVQPSAGQLTAEHVDAFCEDIASATPPSSGEPVAAGE